MLTQLLTVPAAAETLSMSEATVWNLLATGELESVKVGRSRRIPTDAVDAFITRLRANA